MPHRLSLLPFASLGAAFALLCPFGLATTLPAHGQELANDLLQESTVLVARIDTAKLSAPGNERFLQSIPEPARASLLEWMKAQTQQLRRTADQQPVQVYVAMPFSGLMPTVHIVRNQSEDEIDQERDVAYFQHQLANWRIDENAQIRLNGTQVVVGPEAVDSLPLASAQTKAKQFSDALNALGDLPIQIAVVPPQYVRDTLNQTMPNLPESLGGLPTSVLTDGIQNASIGIDPATLNFQLRVQSADEEAAHALAQALPGILRSLFAIAPWSADQLPEDIVDASIDKLPIAVEGDAVILRAAGETVDDAHLNLVDTLVSIFTGTQRTFSANKPLKRIGLAIHNYHSAYHCLPPWQLDSRSSNLKNAKDRSNGKLSWRVHLLPFVGQRALYEQFHLDEPWDSPHNKTLLEQMPTIYVGGSPNIPAGHTTIVVPASDQAVISHKEPTAFRNVLDGLANTVVVVEVNADAAVPWTAPQDYEFDSKNPFAKLSVDNDDRCIVLFADGSVRKIRKNLDVQQANGLFGRFDKIPIQLD